jgi:predicted SAM-dependent methyltransferase
MGSGDRHSDATRARARRSSMVGGRDPPMPAALRLHLGCHAHVVPGWVNIDKSPNVFLSRIPALRQFLYRLGIISATQATAALPPGIVRADVTHGLGYPDSSVEFIYSSHMIEHMARWRGLNLLRECARVLQPGGVLRLATPDLRKWIDEYAEGDRSRGATPADTLMTKLGTYVEMPGTAAQRFVFRAFTGAIHQWLYDFESLSQLLREAGFENVTRRGFRDGLVPDLVRLEHRREGLRVEATKPHDDFVLP